MLCYCKKSGTNFLFIFKNGGLSCSLFCFTWGDHLVYTCNFVWVCILIFLCYLLCFWHNFIYAILLHCLQGRSQPHSPRWARVPLSSFFPQILINCSYFSLNFTYFLPHFGSPGGQVAHPGRPWLRHWLSFFLCVCVCVCVIYCDVLLIISDVKMKIKALDLVSSGKDKKKKMGGCTVRFGYPRQSGASSLSLISK